ncbi:MAG: hydroxymethylbilane synthase [Actinomycetota bacterium]|nr:hydroxymethylbilane synthase [Actinomycetota bacterium]
MTAETAAPAVAAVVLGTRASALARAQTERVAESLRQAWPEIDCRTRPIATRGDRTQASGVPLPTIGGKGLFTAELERALRAGTIDLAVHSLKDLPTEESPGIALGAVCLREDVRDCLVAREGHSLRGLPPGAIVGTSSLRRAAQLLGLRHDLDVRSIRGNVDTRVRKVQDGEFDAVVLAAAGVLRLGLEGAVTEWLETDTMLPAPGQGALGVQCRADDERVLTLLAAIDDPGARAETTAERVFLRTLGAGCTAPVGAHAVGAGPAPRDTVSQGWVRLQALVASPDGRQVVRVAGEGEAAELGERLAREALAAGAGEILDAIRGDQPLVGRRIVLTRPRDQVGELAEALERLGATVLAMPLVDIEPIEDARSLDVALARLEAYRWLVFTSANGVAGLRERLGEKALPAATRVAAVGPATAEAVRTLGVEAAFVPDRFAAEEIAAGLGPLQGVRILLPQADIASPSLAVELRSRGALVDAVAAYRTVAIEPSLHDVSELQRGVDAIVIASGSAARSLVASRVGNLVLGATVVCIGPKTAQAAREVGLPVGLVADEATSEGIIDALTSQFLRSPSVESP